VEWAGMWLKCRAPDKCETLSSNPSPTKKNKKKKKKKERNQESQNVNLRLFRSQIIMYKFKKGCLFGRMGPNANIK
jgi:hypothetical protein